MACSFFLDEVVSLMNEYDASLYLEAFLGVFLSIFSIAEITWLLGFNTFLSGDGSAVASFPFLDCESDRD